MILVDKDDGRSFNSEAIKTQDNHVTFRPKLARNSSYSPGTSRKNKRKYIDDFSAKDQLLLPTNDHDLRRTQSAHALGKYSQDLVHDERIEIALKEADEIDDNAGLKDASSQVRAKCFSNLLCSRFPMKFRIHSSTCARLCIVGCTHLHMQIMRRCEICI